MTYFPPVDPCPRNKKGKHVASLVVPDHEEGAMVERVLWVCGPCGAARILPLTAAEAPLDDVDAERIMRAVGSGWTTNG